MTAYPDLKSVLDEEFNRQQDFDPLLRITYGAGEQSVMHEHSDGVAVFMTDLQVKFTLPDG